MLLTRCIISGILSKLSLESDVRNNLKNFLKKYEKLLTNELKSDKLKKLSHENDIEKQLKKLFKKVEKRC